MKYCAWFWFNLLFVLGVYANWGNDSCGEQCYGEEYRCVRGQCHCANGFLPSHPFGDSCVACPGIGQMCWSYCCSNSGRESLHCWYGTCQRCLDRNDNWICSDQTNSHLLISATQIAMGTALVLGILATFVLLYKLCAAPDVRSYNSEIHSGSRLSVSSLQMYVDERLRDAPPRYSGQNSSIRAGLPSIFPLRGYLNAGFIHDSSVPPPAYSAEQKDEDRPANSPITSDLHI